MRASPQEQTGGIGATEVAAKFQRLNWGVAFNVLHDLGTDLWLAVRDERRFDLGFIVGAQVKAGPSWFRRAHQDASGTVDGWWFYEQDRRHFDAWITHSVPHLLVLHDVTDDVSYWVHVTSDAVEQTGSGARLLVPKAQRVDASTLPELMRVATSARPVSVWEGSAWTGASTLAPRDMLRHALIVPRLLAPHRNAGFDQEPSPEQVVALLAQARVQDVGVFAQRHASVPTLEDALTADSWAWRFVGALGHYLTEGDVDALLRPVADAETSVQRAAAAVVAASALIDSGTPDPAVTILEDALRFDDAEPVDHAWLTAQLARAQTEIGLIVQGREHALAVQSIRNTHPDDVTAGAIAAATASLVFTTSDIYNTDVSALIATSDTTASWWRTQTLSWGLSSSLAESYRQWAHDTSIYVGGANDGHNDLFAATLTSSFACDHSSWRRHQVQLTKNRLLRTSRQTSIDSIHSLLGTLVNAGDDKALGLAVDRVVSEGPTAAASAAARDVDLSRLTRSTAKAAITLLRHAGDVLDADTADRVVVWILDTLANPQTFVDRTRPRFLVSHLLIETLASAVRAAAIEHARSVLNHVLSLPPVTDHSDGLSWGRVVRSIPAEAWDDAAAVRATARAAHDTPDLHFALLVAAGPRDDAARQLLLREAEEGSSAALGYVKDLRELSADAVGAFIDSACTDMMQAIQLARHGGYSSGGMDPAHAVAVLNLAHPEKAQWDAVLQLLGEPQVRGDKKTPTLRTLTRVNQRLPEGIAARIAETAGRIMNHPPRTALFDDTDVDERSIAAALAVALAPDLHTVPARQRLLTDLNGDAAAREASVFLAEQLRAPEDVGVLVALTTDPEPATRYAAVSALAAVIADGAADTIAVDALRAVVAAPGTGSARAAIRGFARAPELSPAATEILEGFGQHLSAWVRQSSSTLIGAAR